MTSETSGSVIKVAKNRPGMGRSTNGLLAYLLDSSTHDLNRERYLYASATNGVSVQDAAQVESVLRADRIRHGKQGKKLECYHVIESFPIEQLDPNDPEHQRIAHEIGLMLAKTAWPSRTVVVVTQRDGKHGSLHNHFVVSNVDNDGYACRDRDMKWLRLSVLHDDLLPRYGLEQRGMPTAGLVPEFKREDKYRAVAMSEEKTQALDDLKRYVREVRDLAIDEESMVEAYAQRGVTLTISRGRRSAPAMRYEITGASGEVYAFNGSRIGSAASYGSQEVRFAANRARQLEGLDVAVPERAVVDPGLSAEQIAKVEREVAIGMKVESIDPAIRKERAVELARAEQGRRENDLAMRAKVALADIERERGEAAADERTEVLAAAYERRQVDLVLDATQALVSDDRALDFDGWVAAARDRNVQLSAKQQKNGLRYTAARIDESGRLVRDESGKVVRISGMDGLTMKYEGDVVGVTSSEIMDFYEAHETTHWSQRVEVEQIEMGRLASTVDEIVGVGDLDARPSSLAELGESLAQAGLDVHAFDTTAGEEAEIGDLGRDGVRLIVARQVEGEWVELTYAESGSSTTVDGQELTAAGLVTGVEANAQALRERDEIERAHAQEYEVAQQKIADDVVDVLTTGRTDERPGSVQAFEAMLLDREIVLGARADGNDVEVVRLGEPGVMAVAARDGVELVVGEDRFEVRGRTYSTEEMLAMLADNDRARVELDERLAESQRRRDVGLFVYEQGMDADDVEDWASRLKEAKIEIRAGDGEREYTPDEFGSIDWQFVRHNDDQTTTTVDVLHEFGIETDEGRKSMSDVGEHLAERERQIEEQKPVELTVETARPKPATVETLSADQDREIEQTESKVRAYKIQHGLAVEQPNEKGYRRASAIEVFNTRMDRRERTKEIDGVDSSLPDVDD